MGSKLNRYASKSNAAENYQQMKQHRSLSKTHLIVIEMTREAGTAEAHAHEELFDRFRDRLPEEFTFERELLRPRLWRSPDRWELAHE